MPTTGRSASKAEIEERAGADRAVDAQVHLVPAGVVAPRRHRAHRVALREPDLPMCRQLDAPALEHLGCAVAGRLDVVYRIVDQQRLRTRKACIGLNLSL